eukprot:scaffold4700_cov32-Tisochrysis_lutea.AAC.1
MDARGLIERLTDEAGRPQLRSHKREHKLSVRTEATQGFAGGGKTGSEGNAEKARAYEKPLSREKAKEDGKRYGQPQKPPSERVEGAEKKREEDCDRQDGHCTVAMHHTAARSTAFGHPSVSLAKCITDETDILSECGRVPGKPLAARVSHFEAVALSVPIRVGVAQFYGPDTASVVEVNPEGVGVVETVAEGAISIGELRPGGRRQESRAASIDCMAGSTLGHRSAGRAKCIADETDILSVRGRVPGRPLAARVSHFEAVALSVPIRVGVAQFYGPE